MIRYTEQPQTATGQSTQDRQDTQNSLKQLQARYTEQPQTATGQSTQDRQDTQNSPKQLQVSLHKTGKLHSTASNSYRPVYTRQAIYTEQPQTATGQSTQDRQDTQNSLKQLQASLNKTAKIHRIATGKCFFKIRDNSSAINVPCHDA